MGCVMIHTVCWYCHQLTPIQPNILVDDTGRARITDFGLVVVLQNTSFKRAFLDDQSVRWMAPEILYTPGTYSKGADVFSFAMVMVEVCYR